MKLIKINKNLIEITLLISIACLIISYSLSYWIASDGFTMMETALYSLINPITFFIGTIFSIAIMMPTVLKDEKSEDIDSKWYVYSLSIFVLTIIIATLIDAFYFYIVDDSISIAFAEGLASFVESNDQETLDSLDILKRLPPFIQGYIQNFTIIFIACFASVPFVFSSVKKKEINKSSRL
ncbi:hypothetical protein P872_19490 [Rhodonellum psychrophilum GCM71 = DSM 17998]|uniref:DUF4199 domain-containing protein n=2 Tax=Rhodonellum TaxID=336827 RepID=U5C0H2_9BACT|nr:MULTISPECIES: hypothetical protein [Rhodonellum]ERM81682.1 hypothetical protein P872_19490 [Rhodonellum psychrophilum GCM71 = DSM 17998]SDY83132.1 hypothetical protein SAMN05444412_10368 [Rhodonellum ikkaensis]